MRTRRTLAALGLAALVPVLAGACGAGTAPTPTPPAGACPPLGGPLAEARTACAERTAERRAFFGDLHVHTRLSFDAYTQDVRVGPADAYAYARGQAILLPPLDEAGNGTLTAQLDRPLDFAAVTDHAEFLGEVTLCTTPGSPTYGSDDCEQYRQGGFLSTALFGTKLSLGAPSRIVDVCGSDGAACLTAARDAWGEIQSAAEAAYDRSSACTFTSFVGYEWTGATDVSNLHRNVVFRDEHVPDLPVSYFEEPKAEGLFRALDCVCEGGVPGCEALVIPHNANLSNGKMFSPRYEEPDTLEAQIELATLRARREVLLEIFQHKGASECMNGVAGLDQPDDPLCEIEQLRNGFDDCGEGVGQLGVVGQGCVSRYDTARGALLAGLEEEERLGVNPFRLGLMASTDTHVATPGGVDEGSFRGHLGNETVPNELLSAGDITAGILGNPGGLVGVWAEENSRHSLFDAMRRRETFGTSGPRMTVRLFAGQGFDASTCEAPDLVAQGYARGVPMGGVLSAPSGAPSLLAVAERDPAAEAGDLDALELVKGTLDAGGAWRIEVLPLAVSQGGAGVDEATCARTGAGAARLCGALTDASLAPGERAFYYVRVVETPSCRWSRRLCLSLPEAERPPSCSDPSVPVLTRELAWSSPIWVGP